MSHVWISLLVLSDRLVDVDLDDPDAAVVAHRAAVQNTRDVVTDVLLTEGYR